jgi:hypothetical protein
MVFYINCNVDFIAHPIPINKQLYLFVHKHEPLEAVRPIRVWLFNVAAGNCCI